MFFSEINLYSKYVETRRAYKEKKAVKKWDPGVQNDFRWHLFLIKGKGYPFRKEINVCTTLGKSWVFTWVEFGLTKLSKQWLFVFLMLLYVLLMSFLSVYPSIFSATTEPAVTTGKSFDQLSKYFFDASWWYIIFSILTYMLLRCFEINRLLQAFG